MATMYAAMYQPRIGNYEHWSIYVKSRDQDLIGEVIGEHPDFEKPALLRAVPQNSGRFKRSVELGKFSENKLRRFEQIYNRAEVDNRTTEWDCQDFVIDVFDECRRAQLFTTSPRKLEANREEAMIYYGARNASWDLVPVPSILRQQLGRLSSASFVRYITRVLRARPLTDDLGRAILEVVKKEWRESEITPQDVVEAMQSAESNKGANDVAQAVGSVLRGGPRESLQAFGAQISAALTSRQHNTR